jgi:hypothetical protein
MYPISRWKDVKHKINYQCILKLIKNLSWSAKLLFLTTTPTCKAFYLSGLRLHSANKRIINEYEQLEEWELVWETEVHKCPNATLSTTNHTWPDLELYFVFVFIISLRDPITMDIEHITIISYWIKIHK